MCCRVVEVCMIMCGNFHLGSWKPADVGRHRYSYVCLLVGLLQWVLSLHIDSCGIFSHIRRVVTLPAAACLLKIIVVVHKCLCIVLELTVSRCCVVDDWLAQACADVRAVPATQYKGRCYDVRRARHERVVGGGRPPSLLLFFFLKFATLCVQGHLLFRVQWS